MDIREANRSEIKALSEMRQIPQFTFPSVESLLALRKRLDVLMPVALVETEMVGVALARLVTVEERRLGMIQYLYALVDEGPVANAIKAALLSRLERQFTALETDGIELVADQPPAFVDHLDRAGYRLEVLGLGGPLPPASDRRFVKDLRSVVPARTRSAARGRRVSWMVN